MPLAIFLTSATASAAGAQSPDGSFMSSQRFMQRDGEVIYRTVCQGCYMPNAQGAVGAGAYPALAADDKLAEAEYPVHVVVNGSKAMGTRNGSLSVSSRIPVEPRREVLGD